MQTITELANSHDLSTLQLSYLQKLAYCSPFVSRMLAKDARLLEALLNNLHKPYTLEEMQNFLAAQAVTDEISLKKALRQLRASVMARIICRDLNGLADLHEVMRTTSQLAECVINAAIDYLNTWLVNVYGQPVDAHGYPQDLIVIGMGKLGGGELNVSSDIDLIFAYESEGETTGEKSISNQDFFVRLAKKLIAAIDEITEDGFVFRVDMRLRPFGSEGALVSSLDALESYYQTNGREWERYAWIKGREVTGGNKVSKLLKPFVFRKYLDYGAFASMRDLKMQIQRDVHSKGMFDNIKLGRGGIREIEFIAQVFQLIRGGQDVSLQVMPTLSVLALLKNKGLLPQTTADELIEAYIFLRNLEHRLMYVEDAQTQELPKTKETCDRITNAMNFDHHPDFSWAQFLARLDNYRQQVQKHFDATFSDHLTAEITQETAIWQATMPEQEAIQALLNAGFADAKTTLQRLNMLRTSQRYSQLPEQSRQRLDKLMPMVIKQSAKTSQPDNALLRAINLFEAICRRASYLALLAEHPHSLELLLKLCAASPWLASYLSAHPILLDELLDARNLYAAPEITELRTNLKQQLQALQGDIEAQMDAVRHFKHSHILRFAAQDIAGLLALETLSDYLSALAEVILQVSLETIWQDFKFKHRDTPKFAIIGYGKLGGKELGYLSDLDIIFLYDDDHDEAASIYARFAQRINSWSNSLTNAGLLYETDLQLRPDGNSGLLVSSVAAFREYQQHKAWVWEHQALTRARFVAGDAAIGEEFEKIRIKVISQTRVAETLKNEVLQMREKMREAQHLKPDTFDLKHSKGGIIDVEFLVQYLVLLNAEKYPQLTNNIGNIGLLTLMANLSLIDTNLAQKTGDSYREFRKLIHQNKLQGQDTKINAQEAREHQQPVQTLWDYVFEAQRDCAGLANRKV